MFHPRSVRAASAAVCLLGSLLLAGLELRAQDVRASLSGLVADPTGAPIPRARVTVANSDTGVATTTDTNDAGRYTVLYLNPGPYSLTVEANGFRQFVRENLRLGTAERAGLDVRLEIGQITERITVEAEAPLLETETASRGNLVTTQQVLDLPSNGRSIFNLVLALPGVTKMDRNWGSFGNAALVNSTRISINGGIARENEMVMDGVTNTQPDRNVTFQPPLEAVSEFTVQVSSFDASYGRYGGGVTAVTTKSGTNALHGTLFEYNRTAALAANPWAFNFRGVPRPGGVSNQFGFEVDGPVRIPKLFDGRNRMFFMLALDARITRSAAGSATTLPTDALRRGDFSAVPRVIYDPLTTRVVDGRIVRDPFPGNIIPAERIHPVSRRLLEYLPQPNLAVGVYGLQNYLAPFGTRSDYGQWLGRLDYRVNERNTVYFSHGRLPYSETDEVLFGADNPADVSRENPLSRDFYRYVADWTSTLSPTTVLNLRAGFVRYTEQNLNRVAQGFDPRQLGFDPALVSQFRNLQFPRVEIGGFYTSFGSDRVLDRVARDTQSYQANLNWIRGKHQVRSGAEFRVYNDNRVSPGLASGRYRFSSAFTAADPTRLDARSGEEFASFLLGYPAEGGVELTIDPAFQGRYWALFVQDDIKLTRRISLNLGLRWDYEQPYRERYNRMVRGFAFGEANPLAAAMRAADPANCPACAGLTGGLLYAGNEGEQRLAFRPDRNNIQPRIGVAVQLARSTVLRGGYGLYYLAASGGQATTGFSATTPLIASADAGLTPRVTFTNAFPGPLTPPIGSGEGLSTNLGQNLDVGYVNRDVPLSHQFSLGVQHVLPGGFVVDAAYSGNLTRRYPVDVELNAIPRDLLGRPATFYTERVANPFANLLPLNPARNAATVPRQNLLVPFPQFNSIALRSVPLGTNDYHALQARLTRRYAFGMTLNLAYTWSKTLEERSFLNNQDFNLEDIDASRLERRLAEFDVPHKLTALWTYELPFGRGKRIGASLRGLADKLASGWQVNLIGTLQSGFPAAFPNAPNLEARSAVVDRDLFRGFDTSLFPRVAPNLAYEYRTFPTRFPDVRLYPLRNLDLGVAKKTTLTERVRLELRAELFNATNTPWFNAQNAQGTNVTRQEFGWYAFSSGNSARGVTLIGKLTW